MASVGEALGEVLGYALGIAISPIPIAAVILMLFSAHARLNAPVFALGWLLGIAGVATVVLLIPGLGDSTDGEPSTTAGVIKGLLGALLLLGAARQWQTRPAPGESPPMPGWMTGIDQLRAPTAFGLSLLLSAVNPKNLVLAAAAGVSIGAADLAVSQTVVAVVVFTVLASLTIIVPTLGYLLAGQRVQPALTRAKDWLIANNGAVTAVLFLVFAAILLGDAVTILTS